MRFSSPIFQKTREKAVAVPNSFRGKVLFSNSLMGSFGKGSLRFREISATFRRIAINVFFAIFRELSANFPRTFHKTPSLTTP